MKLGKRATLYLGPPGTGKTQRLQAEVARREPGALAYVTHTRAAAAEARGRSGRPAAEHTTLHALCFRLLGARREDMLQAADYQALGEALGLRFARWHDAEEAGVGGQGVGDRLRAIVDYHAARWPLAELSYEGHGVDPFQLRRYVEALAAYKRDTGKRDFADLLRDALTCAPLPLDLAVIDEAQDLSRLQWLVAARLFARAKEVLVAGDDDQAIFRWAGADVETFLGLGATAETEVLTQSHRCPLLVSHFANAVAAQITARYTKPWAPRHARGEVAHVARPEDVDLSRSGTHLLLARNGYLLAEWERTAREQGVAYARRGRPGVDPKHRAAIRAWEVARGRRLDVDEEQLVNQYAPPEQQLAGGPWYEALVGIPLADRDYYRVLLARGRRLSDPPRVDITTIHGAKGREADHVAVLADRSALTTASAEASPDDEHRVAYVAATRARETLTLVAPAGLHRYEWP